MFVSMTQSTMELIQKLVKNAQKMLATGCLHEGEIPMNEIGGQRGGGHLLEGDVFLEAYGKWLVYHTDTALCYILHLPIHRQ